MTIETLVAAVDQRDHSLVGKMNIQTDAIVGNQCGQLSREEFELNGSRIIYLNTPERGVGKNRNLLLENAAADICVFADDDMRFVDGYADIVLRAFGECPDADILAFNLIEKNPKRYINRNIKRVRFYNYARYGAARLVIRREAVCAAEIKFNLSFGGGTRYSCGEDTIFLSDCLKKKLKIYAVPYAIAEIDQKAESTWFKGYNEKFFSDKGALYRRLHPVLWPAYVLRFTLRYRGKYKASMPFIKAVGYMLSGGIEYRREI